MRFGFQILLLLFIPFTLLAKANNEDYVSITCVSRKLFLKFKELEIPGYVDVNSQLISVKFIQGASITPWTTPWKNYIAYFKHNQQTQPDTFLYNFLALKFCKVEDSSVKWNVKHVGALENSRTEAHISAESYASDTNQFAFGEPRDLNTDIGPIFSKGQSKLTLSEWEVGVVEDVKVVRRFTLLDGKLSYDIIKKLKSTGSIIEETFKEENYETINIFLSKMKHLLLKECIEDPTFDYQSILPVVLESKWGKEKKISGAHNYIIAETHTYGQGNKLFAVFRKNAKKDETVLVVATSFEYTFQKYDWLPNYACLCKEAKILETIREYLATDRPFFDEMFEDSNQVNSVFQSLWPQVTKYKGDKLSLISTRSIQSLRFWVVACIAKDVVVGMFYVALSLPSITDDLTSREQGYHIEAVQYDTCETKTQVARRMCEYAISRRTPSIDYGKSKHYLTDEEPEFFALRQDILQMTKIPHKTRYVLKFTKDDLSLTKVYKAEKRDTTLGIIWIIKAKPTQNFFEYYHLFAAIEVEEISGTRKLRHVSIMYYTDWEMYRNLDDYIARPFPFTRHEAKKRMPGQEKYDDTQRNAWKIIMFRRSLNAQTYISDVNSFSYNSNAIITRYIFQTENGLYRGTAFFTVVLKRTVNDLIEMDLAYVSPIVAKDCLDIAISSYDFGSTLRRDIEEWTNVDVDYNKTHADKLKLALKNYLQNCINTTEGNVPIPEYTLHALETRNELHLAKVKCYCPEGKYLMAIFQNKAPVATVYFLVAFEIVEDISVLNVQMEVDKCALDEQLNWLSQNPLAFPFRKISLENSVSETNSAVEEILAWRYGSNAVVTVGVHQLLGNRNPHCIVYQVTNDVNLRTFSVAVIAVNFEIIYVTNELKAVSNQSAGCVYGSLYQSTKPGTEYRTLDVALKAYMKNTSLFRSFEDWVGCYLLCESTKREIDTVHGKFEKKTDFKWAKFFPLQVRRVNRSGTKVLIIYTTKESEPVTKFVYAALLKNPSSKCVLGLNHVSDEYESLEDAKSMAQKYKDFAFDISWVSDTNVLASSQYRDVSSLVKKLLRWRTNLEEITLIEKMAFNGATPAICDERFLIYSVGTEEENIRVFAVVNNDTELSHLGKIVKNNELWQEMLDYRNNRTTDFEAYTDTEQLNKETVSAIKAAVKDYNSKTYNKIRGELQSAKNLNGKDGNSKLAIYKIDKKRVAFVNLTLTANGNGNGILMVTSF